MGWARRKFRLRGYRTLARRWHQILHAEQTDLFVRWATCRSHLVTR